MSIILRNCWYPAAWDFEVGRNPFGRVICNEPVVLYRTLAGEPVALWDACPHRLLPLSMGTLEGDTLRCGYHGIAFDARGQCVEMPGQEHCPKNFKVEKVYPAVERHRFVWIWIGEPAEADPALIPDLSPYTREGWTFDGGVYQVKVGYQLLVDNLMDLSHETYVHPNSIGQREIVESVPEARREGDSAFVSRWMHAIEAPPFWRTALKRPGLVDRWQICQFLLPAIVLIDVGVAPTGTGAPQGDRSQGVNGFVINVMTPATDKTTWYFWGMARNFDIHDAGFTRRFREQQAGVFLEDVEILEAQQQRLDEYPEAKLRNFAIDAGGVHARAIIDRKLREQSKAE